MTPLQQVANEYAQDGWSISSISDEQFVATKKGSLGCVFWIGVIVGLLLYIVPGLLILIIGLVTQRERTVIITKVQAEEILAQRQLEAQQLAEQKRLGAEARKAKLADASGLRQRWLALSENMKGILVIGFLLAIAALAIMLLTP
jgi:hypothetical protein